MTIFALDPGKTTGYCLLDNDCEVCTVGEILGGLNGLKSSELLQAASKYDIHEMTVVIEFVPTAFNGKLSRELAEINSYLRQLFPLSIPITPGVWKPNKRVRQYPLPTEEIVSPHARDAYRIAVYHYLYGGRR